MLKKIKVHRTNKKFTGTALYKAMGYTLSRRWINARFLEKNYYGVSTIVTSCCDKTERKNMQVTEYLQYMNKNHPSDYYLKDLKVSPALYDRIFKAGIVSKYVDNWFERLPEPLFPSARWFYIGKKGTYSGFHYDVFNSAAWNILYEGRKIWYFLDKNQAYTFKKLDSVTCDVVSEKFNSAYSIQYCIQEPGDVIFVESGHPHMVVNLETSVSFTENIVNASNVEMVKSALKKSRNKAWLNVFTQIQKIIG